MGMRPFLPPIPELALVGFAAAWAGVGCERGADGRLEREPASSAVSHVATAPPTASARASAASPPGSTRPAGAASWRRRLKVAAASRYLEGRCKKGSYPGWDGFPLRRCRYAVPDTTGHKSTEVIVLNPSAGRLARWIRSACRGHGDDCPERLTERILVQSSAQFPVAGVVLEDIRPTDGHYEMYCFRHGVRVEVVGFDTQSTERPTAEHVRTCLEGELTRATSFARIAGTTPNDYRAWGGTEAVGEDGAPTLAWLDTTRALYQAAWQSEDNALLAAWVVRNIAERRLPATPP